MPDTVRAHRRISTRTAAAIVSTALVLAACTDGSSSDPAPSAAAAATAPAATTTAEAPDATTAPPATTTAPPTTEAPDATTTTTTTTMAPEPAAPPPAERPLVAIDRDGDAVFFPTLDAEPVLLFDGPDPDDEFTGEGPGPNVVDGVAITPDGSRAFVGLCCEPISGVILPASPPGLAGDETGVTPIGYAPAVDPTGTVLAAGQIVSPGVSLSRVADGTLLDAAIVHDGADNPFSPYDVVWLSDSRLAVLGVLNDPEPSWVVRLVSIEGDVLVVEGDRFAAPFGGLEFYRFAGVLDGGRIGVHDVDAAIVLAVPTDDPSGEIEELALPGPSRSAWFAASEPTILVDADGVLRVGDRIVPGDYDWARR